MTVNIKENKQQRNQLKEEESSIQKSQAASVAARSRPAQVGLKERFETCPRCWRFRFIRSTVPQRWSRQTQGSVPFLCQMRPWNVKKRPRNRP